MVVSSRFMFILCRSHPTRGQVWVGGSAVGDIIITFSMMYYLMLAKRRTARYSTHFKRTTTLLTRLIMLSVETGLSCAAVATAGLVLFVAYEDDFYWSVPALVISTLYSNSLLAVSLTAFS